MFDQKFLLFLNGAEQKEDNSSLIRTLPNDILYHIWVQYITPIHLHDLIETGQYHAISYKIKNNINIEHLYYSGIYTIYFVNLACQKGAFDILKLFIDNNFHYTTQIVLDAVEGNNIEILNWLYDNKVKLGIEKLFHNTMLFKNAINNCCKLEILEWLYNIDKNNFHPYTLDSILKVDKSKTEYKIQVLKWIVSKNLFNKPNFCFINRHLSIVIEDNDIELLNWIITNLNEYINFVPSNHISIKTSNIKILEWILSISNNILLPAVKIHAVSTDSVDILELAMNRSNNIDFIDLMDLACKNGSFNVLKYLYFEKKYKLSLENLHRILRSGYVDIYDWMIEQEPTLITDIDYKEILKTAITYDQNNVIVKLIDKINLVKNIPSLVRYSCESSNLEILKILYKKSYKK